MHCDGGAVFDARHVVLVFLASARPLSVPRVMIQWRARHPSSLGGHFTLGSIGLTPHWLSASRRQLTAEPHSHTSSTMQVGWVILGASMFPMRVSSIMASLFVSSHPRRPGTLRDSFVTLTLDRIIFLLQSFASRTLSTDYVSDCGVRLWTTRSQVCFPAEKKKKRRK